MQSETRSPARTEHAEALEFVAHASHDMRQPLMSVLAYAELIAHETDAAKLAALRDRLQLAAQSLRAMGEHLLDTYRLFGADVDRDREDIAIADVLARVDAEMRPLALAQGLELRIAETHAATRTLPALLDRVLCNLVGNAIRHAEHGAILIGVRKAGARWRIEVVDTGPGMSAETRATLLDAHPCYGVDESGETHGLGLAVIKRLCDVMQHKVSVRARLGGGTIFAVEVPRVQREVVRLRLFNGERVLVTITDEVFCAELIEHLHEWGCAPIAKLDAAEAPFAVIAESRLGASQDSEPTHLLIDASDPPTMGSVLAWLRAARRRVR